MKVIHKSPVFQDERGVITDIIDDEAVNSITILTTKKGEVRGNHYHKFTTQYSYVLQGKFMLFTQVEGEEIESKIVVEGDLVTSMPLERHAFKAMEDSVLLAFCSGPRAGKQYETDTFRLPEPISI